MLLIWHYNCMYIDLISNSNNNSISWINDKLDKKVKWSLVLLKDGMTSWTQWQIGNNQSFVQSKVGTKIILTQWQAPLQKSAVNCTNVTLNFCFESNFWSEKISLNVIVNPVPTFKYFWAWLVFHLAFEHWIQELRNSPLRVINEEKWHFNSESPSFNSNILSLNWNLRFNSGALMFQFAT